MHFSNDVRKRTNLFRYLCLLTGSMIILSGQYAKENAQAERQWTLFVNDLALTIKVNYQHIETLHFGLELTNTLSRFADISDETIQTFTYWATQHITQDIGRRAVDEIARLITTDLTVISNDIQRAIKAHSYLHKNLTYIKAWGIAALLYMSLMAWVYCFSAMKAKDTDIIFNALNIVVIATAFKLSGGFQSMLWVLWLVLFAVHAFTFQSDLRYQDRQAWTQQIPYGLTVLLCLFWGAPSLSINAWKQYGIASLFVLFPAYLLYHTHAFRDSPTQSESKRKANATRKTVVLLLAITGIVTVLSIWVWLIPQSFRIAMVPWIGYGPFYIAKEKGYFDEEHVDVELVEYHGPQGVRDLFAANKIEAAATTVENLILMSSLDLPAQVAMGLDSSFGADGIASRTYIRRILDLKNKDGVVAIQPGLTNMYLLMTLLDLANVSPDEIQTKVMDDEGGVAAFLRGDVQAIVTWEPFLSRALRRNDSHLLFSTKSAEAPPNLIVDVLMVRDDVIEHRSKDIIGVINGWNRAVSYLADNRKDGIRIIANAMHETEESVATMLCNVQLFAARQNKAFLSQDAQQGSYRDTAERAVRIYKRRGFIQKSPAIDDLFKTAVALNNAVQVTADDLQLPSSDCKS